MKFKFEEDFIYSYEKRDWAITIEIPAFKYVPKGKKQAKYSSLSKNEQEETIMKFKKLCEDNIIECKLIFENHKDGRRHAHGTIFNITEETLKENLIPAFCHFIGIKKETQFKQIVYHKPIFNCHGWCTYCIKDLEKEQQEQNIKNLVQSVEEEEEDFNIPNNYMF